MVCAKDEALRRRRILNPDMIPRFAAREILPDGADTPVNKAPTTTYSRRTLLIVAAATSLLLVILSLAALYGSGWLAPPANDRQSNVHDMGQSVMPFDLGETTHIFEMTEAGGIQEVVSDGPTDNVQISLIREHLQHEALRFRAGDFSDPTSLHGSDMPGVSDLAQGADRITIEYADLPNGGQITFTTSDLRLLTALHRWFGAQLSDHASDATYR